jgi:ABC-type amino acid transport substrate-binding protein
MHNRRTTTCPALAGLFSTLLLASLMLVSVSLTIAQATRTPVPLATLVPPTPLPPLPSATPQPPLVQSAIARIKARVDPTSQKPTVVIGIPYNIYRFSTLTDTGDIQGFEADIAQAIADDWGCTLQLRQVTQENALDLLMTGQIDLLMGQVLLSRDAQSQLDYSDPIFANRQVALVLNDAGLQDIKDLNGKTVGVVAGSRAEDAYNAWASANGVQATVTRYTMLDEGLRALVDKKITALAGDRWELDRKVNGIIPGVGLLPTPFRVEPYGIAMRRYDDNLRTLVNRTLQRLVSSNRYAPIYDQWFPKDLLPEELRVIPRVWSNLDADSRGLGDFPVDVVLPSRPVVTQVIKAGQSLRVAGLGAPLDPNGKPSIVEAFNQALVNELVRRWGVRVQPVPDSYGKGEDMLASGQADLAVGVEPHWSGVDRIDYAGMYAQRGYRMMVRIGSDIEGFGSLRIGVRQIGVYADDANAWEIVKKQTDAVGIPEATLKRVTIRTDADAIDAVFNTQVARVLVADGLRLWPLVQANPKLVQLTKTTYDPHPLAFGVPRNDADFRVLVEVTLQDMYQDGTYQKLWQENFGLGDPMSFVVWPGPTTVFGVKTTG